MLPGVGYVDHRHGLARANQVPAHLRQKLACNGLYDVGRPFDPRGCERTRESARSGLYGGRAASVGGVCRRPGPLSL